MGFAERPSASSGTNEAPPSPGSAAEKTSTNRLSLDKLDPGTSNMTNERAHPSITAIVVIPEAKMEIRKSAAPTCTSVSVNVPEIWRWFDVDASVTPDDQSARLDEVEVEVELEKDKQSAASNLEIVPPGSRDMPGRSDLDAFVSPDNYSPVPSDLGDPSDHNRALKPFGIKDQDIAPTQNSPRSNVQPASYAPDEERLWDDNSTIVPVVHMSLLEWKTVESYWKEELGEVLPYQFPTLSHNEINFLHIDPMTTGDKLKNAFEAYSGESWDWWPLQPPRKPLQPGRVRLKWNGYGGQTHSADVSENLAEKVRTVLDKHDPQRHTGPQCLARNPSTSKAARGLGQSANPSTASATGSGLSRQRAPVQQGSSSAAAGQPAAATRRSTAQGKPAPEQASFVLFCVRRGNQLRATQIEMKDSRCADGAGCADDAAFIATLKAEYRRLRGFWRYWFHPQQLAYCHFARFTRYYVDHLARVCYELPIDESYDYELRPPEVPYLAPVSPIEWYHRLHNRNVNRSRSQDLLRLIPKRDHGFQTSVHVGGREDMWGLHAEFRISAAIVFVWQFTLTAAGWILRGWWLSGHPGDLQTAAVPISVIIACLTLFWLPLQERFLSPVEHEPSRRHYQ